MRTCADEKYFLKFFQKMAIFGSIPPIAPEGLLQTWICFGGIPHTWCLQIEWNHFEPRISLGWGVWPEKVHNFWGTTLKSDNTNGVGRPIGDNVLLENEYDNFEHSK